jgi:hypothetical protein
MVVEILRQHFNALDTRVEALENKLAAKPKVTAAVTPSSGPNNNNAVLCFCRQVCHHGVAKTAKDPQNVGREYWCCPQQKRCFKAFWWDHPPTADDILNKQ